MKGKDNDEKKSLGDYGIIFLSGSIDAATAQSVCQEIIQINIEHSADLIQMIINSVGGYVSAGFAIIDMMEWSRLPVYTTGVGMVASMGLAIFMAGEKGQRVLTPRTSVLSHRFSGMNAGNYSDSLRAGRRKTSFTSVSYGTTWSTQCSRRRRRWRVSSSGMSTPGLPRRRPWSTGLPTGSSTRTGR